MSLTAFFALLGGSLVLAFAIILLTNLLVVLGSVRARRAVPLSAPIQQIPQESAPG